MNHTKYNSVDKGRMALNTFPCNEHVDMLVCMVRDSLDYIHGLENKVFRSDGRRRVVFRMDGIYDRLHWRQYRLNLDKHDKGHCNFVHNTASSRYSGQCNGMLQDPLNTAT
jgi:hypothetical protein